MIPLHVILLPHSISVSLVCHALGLTATRQISGALAHMHALGVLHRDVKLQNIFMSEAGEPVLGDFDLSRDAAGSIAFVRSTCIRSQPMLNCNNAILCCIACDLF